MQYFVNKGLEVNHFNGKADRQEQEPDQTRFPH